MISGVLLWGSGKPGLAEPLTPGGLAAAHAAWRTDLARFGPWREFQSPLLFPGESHLLWKPRDGTEAAAVLVCGPCASTMDVAWRLVEQGSLPPWGTILAVAQTAGRGRHRRHWLSPPGNIYASWLWPEERAGRDSAWNTLRSLVAGYLLVFAFEELGIRLEIKWPNDLIWQGRKLGGILLEQKGQKTVVGVGINLASSPADSFLKQDFAIPATCLLREGIELAPLSGWLNLVRSARNCYETQLQEMDPYDFVHRAMGRLAWLGRSVVVRREGLEGYRARIVGLAPDGGLVLDRDGAEEILYSGSLLPG